MYGYGRYVILLKNVEPVNWKRKNKEWKRESDKKTRLISHSYFLLLSTNADLRSRQNDVSEIKTCSRTKLLWLYRVVLQRYKILKNQAKKEGMTFFNAQVVYSWRSREEFPPLAAAHRKTRRGNFLPLRTTQASSIWDVIQFWRLLLLLSRSLFPLLRLHQQFWGKMDP